MCVCCVYLLCKQQQKNVILDAINHLTALKKVSLSTKYEAAQLF